MQSAGCCGGGRIVQIPITLVRAPWRSQEPIFREFMVAHRGFSIKVDQSNRHSVTQQSGGSFSHQTLPQDVNIAELAPQLNGCVGSGPLDNRSHHHPPLHCDSVMMNTLTTDRGRLELQGKLYGVWR